MPPDSGGRSRLTVISALGIVEIFAWGTSFHLPAVLAGPISRDTGWPLTWVVGGFTLGLIVAALASPQVGVKIDRYGGRPVLASAALLFASGHIVLGLAPSLPVYLAGWLLLGLGMACGLYDSAFAALGQLYGARARMAITYLTLWGGFATTVCWPLSGFLVDQLGWRGTCFAYAGLHLVISLPLVLGLIPSAPGRAHRASAPEAMTGSLSPREQRTFLLFAAVPILSGAILSIVAVHLLILLQGHGMLMASAIAAAAVIGPAKVATRVMEIAGRGRHHPLWTLTAASAAIALGLLLLAARVPGVGIWLAIYGGGNGLYSIARSTVPLALFGHEHYAVLNGRLARPAWIAQAFSPSLAAFLLTQAGPDALWRVLFILALTNACLVGALWWIRKA